MRRTTTQYLTDTGKVLASCRTLSRHVPGLSDLEQFPDAWSDHVNRQADVIDAEDLHDNIRDIVAGYFETTSPEEIAADLAPLRSDPRLKAALIHLKGFAAEEHHIYFGANVKGVPAQFCRTNLPAFAVNRNQGREIRLYNPITKTTGTTTLIIEHSALYSYDLKTITAMSEVMRDKPQVIHGDAFVSFTTSKAEIAKEMGYSNPHAENVGNAIWNSLKRMRACTLTWKTGKTEIIGGIISKARALEEDSSYNIEIYLDADFLKLYKYGYALPDKRAIYDMRGRELNMYFFLLGQIDYTTKGTYTNNIFTVWDRAGLDMPGSNKPERKKRYEFRQLMERCKALGIVGRYSIRGDLLRITSPGKLFAKALPKSTNDEQGTNSQ
jgi:hypothetical protein